MTNKIQLVKDNEVYTGFDDSSLVSYCTPRFMGFSICVDASASAGIVTITIKLNTPAGSYSKSFSFDSNTCFAWQPIPLAKLEVCIADFDTSSGEISFDLSIKLCVKVPILGWKCISYSHKFTVPIPGENEYARLEDLSDEHFALAMLLAEKTEQSCNCSH